MKVGDMQITEAAFEQYIADLAATQGPPDLSRQKLGDNYSLMLVLSKQAVAHGLDNSPAVMRQLAIDRMQILSNAEFARLKDQATPSAQEIKEYYESHKDEFAVVQVKRVFIWSGGKDSKAGHSMTAEQAQALSEAIHHAYTTGGDVYQVIKQTPHGTEDVVFDEQPLTFQKGELPAMMDKPVFALKEGEWTEFDNGPSSHVFVHMIKFGYEDLADASPRIEQDLQKEELREKLNALKSKTGIWMDETYFASKAPIPLPSTQPEASGQSKSSTERGEK